MSADFLAMLSGSGATPVEEDPYPSGLKRMIRGVAETPETKRSIIPPQDVSNTETTRAMVSPGTPQPDPSLLRDEDAMRQRMAGALDRRMADAEFEGAQRGVGPVPPPELLRDTSTATAGVYNPVNPKRQELLNAVSDRILALVKGGNPIFYKAQAAKAQELAGLTALQRGLEQQDWQERSGAEIPEERQSRAELARARARQIRQQAEAEADPNHPSNRSLEKVGGAARVWNKATGQWDSDWERPPATENDPTPHIATADLAGSDPATATRIMRGIDPRTGKVIWENVTPGVYKGESPAVAGAKAGAAAAAVEGQKKPARDAAAEDKAITDKIRDLDRLGGASGGIGEKMPAFQSRAAEVLDEIRAYRERNGKYPPGVNDTQVARYAAAAQAAKAGPSANRKR